MYIFKKELVNREGKRHVLFKNICIGKNGDKTPKKPKTCLGGGRKESRSWRIQM